MGVRINLHGEFTIAMPHELLGSARVHPGQLHERPECLPQCMEIAISGESPFNIEWCSFDAWGNRRNADDWTASPAPALLAPSATDRGFTGHEQLDHLQLVHMNGRIYDPVIARFISPDPVLQFPENLQSFNRYSYVLNRPLSLTDPSGFQSEGEKIGTMAGSISGRANEIVSSGISSQRQIGQGERVLTIASQSEHFRDSGGGMQSYTQNCAATGEVDPDPATAPEYDENGVSKYGYKEQDQAGVAALGEAKRMTDEDEKRREHGGYIVYDPDGVDEDGNPAPWKFTKPKPPENELRTEVDIDPKRDQPNIPFKIEAWYHSHGAAPHRKYNPDHFSGDWGKSQFEQKGDTGKSDDWRMDGYLITPSGVMKHYRWGSRNYYRKEYGYGDFSILTPKDDGSIKRDSYPHPWGG